jgi:hypothetical protein
MDLQGLIDTVQESLDEVSAELRSLDRMPRPKNSAEVEYDRGLAIVQHLLASALVQCSELQVGDLTQRWGVQHG